MAVVMVAAFMPVSTYAADLDTDAYINGVTLDAPTVDCYGGYKVTRASDPTGLYAAAEGWKGDDENTKYYFVSHYVYLAKYDAYVADEDFGVYGSDDVLKADFAASEYSFIGTTTTEKAEVAYYDADALDGTTYHTEKKLNNANDPTGVYGCNAYTSSDGEGNLLETGVMIHRFVIAPGTTKYIKDSTFAEVRITDENLPSSPYSYVYEEVFNHEYLEWTGNVAIGQFGNFKDANGTHYAVDDAHNVYTLDGDTVQVGNTEYFYLTRTSAVKYNDLTPAVEGYVPCTHNYKGEYTNTPTCTAAGTILWTCTKCGDSYTSTAAALGHSWNAGKVTKKATPTATGVKTFTCTRCGAKKTQTIKKCAKYANPMVAKANAPKIKYSKLKNKNQTIAKKNAFNITKAQGKVTFTKKSGNKAITVNSAGKVTVKKGLKVGTYKVNVQVKAAGNATYKAKTTTVTLVVKVVK